MRASRATIRENVIRILLPIGAALAWTGVAPAEDTTVPETAAADSGQAPQIDANAVLKDGQEALKSGDYQKALTAFDQLVPLFERASSSGGDNAQKAYQMLPSLYVLHAQALTGVREFDAADAEYKKVLDSNSDFLPALLGRGKMQLEAGANDVALQSFQSALEQDRSNVEVLFGLGKSYALLGGFQQAIKPLTTVISKDDKNAEAYRFRAVANAGLGKYKLAHEDMDKSIQLDPEPYETYFALGTIYLKEEKYNDAANAMGEAIKLYKPKGDSDEPYAQGYLTKAAALVEAGKVEKDAAKKLADYKEALADCDSTLELLGDVPAYASAKAATEYRRGVCLRMMGKLGDAINAFTEAIKLNPDLGEAYFRRGICFFQMNENDLALADFQKASTLSYEDPRSRLWEGFTQAKLNDYQQAIRAYGQAIAESNRYTPAYVNRGLAYMMLGEYDKALADFDEAIRLEPTESDHYFKRGVIYEKKGKQQEAADSFSSAIKFNGKNVLAYRHAATALAALGHNDLASEYRSKADALAPKEQPSTK
jgi:tetratricopeptide (TPR) repeat protein